MAWTEKSVVDQRREFVHLALSGDVSMAELCRRFEISRKTGYKWLGRYGSAVEPASLTNASRRPLSSPKRSSPELEQQVIGLRAKHPAWGGRKIGHVLRRDGGVQVAPSTVTSILHRHGLIEPAASAAATAWKRFEHPHPNSLWQMDFKGHFATHKGRCHPLTILDDHSRYNMALVACTNEQFATVHSALRDVFRRYGMPLRINTDNGHPWGSSGGGYLTELGAWLIRLGIRTSHSTPLHPQTNGKDERFHKTLLAEVIAHRTFADPLACQIAFDDWRPMYNSYRPHEMLGMKTPADRYTPSPIAFPEVLPTVEYPSGDTVRRVCKKGRISLKGSSIFISTALYGQPVALRHSPDAPDCLDVFFCHQRIKQLTFDDLNKAK